MAAHGRWNRADGTRGLKPRRVLLLAALLAVASCGDQPLDSMGWRSSDWINEPTVPTTVAVNTTTPTVVAVDDLFWSNDVIETENLNDPEAMLAEVFARRGGDRFVQASRFEIAVALPDVAFPARVPAGAEWVSSQLIFDNDGNVADDPSAAFGIWSTEPYTRSRSVAQMAVLRVSMDLEAATALATGEADPSCARFTDRDTDACEVLAIGDHDAWLLRASGGPTLVWYEGPYRYELFGRSFVPQAVLRSMVADMVTLTSIGAESS